MRYRLNSDGTKTPIAGRGRAEYGASTVRKGTWSFTETIPVTAGWKTTTITFTDAMPDTDYEIIITPTGQFGVLSQDAMTPYQINNKTVNGFTLIFWNNSAEAGLVDIQGTYTAFKLYTDTEYNNILAATPSDASASNKLVSANDLAKLLLPAGEYTLNTVLCSMNNVYIGTVFLPFITNGKNITVSLFRPAGQTAIKDENPTVYLNGNTIYCESTNSAFSDFVGKNAIIKFTIAY